MKMSPANPQRYTLQSELQISKKIQAPGELRRHLQEEPDKERECA